MEPLTPASGDAQSTGAPTEERAALTRDLSEFLIELSIALHRHAMYPEGHPSLAPAVTRVMDRLLPLLENRGALSLGVARNQLVIEGVATDAQHPVLRDLAGRLHRHHLGAVTVRPGISTRELGEALAVLAVEADQVHQPLGLGDPQRLHQWDHLRLYPVTYERLELVDGSGAPADEAEQQRETRTRAAQLWIGLARAALAADDAESTEPAVVARAIARHARGDAYAQVVVGYMLQMADELRAAGGETADLRRRMSSLIQSLDSGTVRRLLEMGGDGAQREKFLLSAAEGLTANAVIDLVRAAGGTPGGQTISHAMLRMLRKLAHHAESGGARRRVADTAVRDQVTALIRGWSLADPNPDAYRAALERMASTTASDPAATDERRAEPQRLIQMALEIGISGEPVTRAVNAVVAAGEIGWLVGQLRDAPASAASDAIWAALITPERIHAVADAEHVDAAVLDALISRAGLDAVPYLLDALTVSESLFARSVLLKRIAALGDAVGPLVVERLTGRPWYALRNMLGILSELAHLPEGFAALPYLQHDEPRVRREALRILIRQTETRERAIVSALTDRDPRNQWVGLQAAFEACPETAVPLVVSAALEGEASETRALAIRVLGSIRQPVALETLLSIAAPRWRLVGRKFPPKSEELLAALRTLHAFADDARAREVLAAAARAKDPDIARAALAAQT